MLLVGAAETSGERLAAGVVERLGVEAAGMAGPLLEATGVRALVRPDGLGTVGVVEALGGIGRARRAWRTLEAALDRADGVLTVDSAKLFLPVGEAARRRGLPVVHVASPQIWAWRRHRVAQIARSVDHLLCLLPFEPMLYAGTGVHAEFVGHPAADAALVGPADGRTVILAPGSRPAEVQRLWPVFREVARRMPHCRFRVVRAPGMTLDLGGLEEGTLDEPADAALVASGTITLELAARGIPMVVAYQLHPITWEIGRRLVRVPWVALPNLVAGETVVPEVLQHLDPDVLAAEVQTALDGAQRAGLARVAERLRGPGALDRIAESAGRRLGLA